MTRIPLPARRQNVTRSVTFNGRAFTVCIGFDDAGHPREVFADGEREGSGMQAFLDDACIVISIALQHRIPAEDLMRSLGTVPAFVNGEEVEQAASPIGEILHAVQQSEPAQ